MPVAVKRFNPDYDSLREEFVKEASLVSLLKVCTVIPLSHVISIKT